MNYDFSKLNDREFEHLGASILEKILNTRIETFKTGKDGGVDGRFWIGTNKEGIVQCKHYLNTPYNQLISKLRNEESKKVDILKPERYILIISKELSRKNKQEIKGIFNPYIKSVKDIWGIEDLNAFLSKKQNQDIVEQNFKLWLTSTSVLDLIYNNAIKGRSESTINEIKEKAYKYALTENHKKAITILEEKNVIILTGEPGIGKTTLANNLSLYCTAKGYEFCDIEENFTEAENIFRENEKKQIVFYCDDFLGSNLYDAINSKRDSHIVKFINRVRKDSSKKFILTSRTNILNKAYSLSHRFKNDQINNNEFLLKVENLTEIDKAQILYNHIYHSKLSKDYIDKIYEDKKYREIIRHRNFNPRIIEFITDDIRIGDTTSDKYWDYITKNLNEPEEIWADYFQHQADDCVRALTFLTVYNKGKIHEDTLRNAYNQFIKLHTINLGDHTDKSFETVRKLVIKSLLNRNQIRKDSYEYVLFNPSISDFVLKSYSKETELISNILKSLGTKISIEYFNTLTIFKKISKKNSLIIHENLFDYFFDKKLEEEDWDFLILLAYIDFFNENLKGRIEKFITTLSNSHYASGNYLSELLAILKDFDLEIKLKDYQFLIGFIEKTTDEDTLKELFNFIDQFQINDLIILNVVEEQFESYVIDIIDNDGINIDYKRYIENNYYPDGNTDYRINTRDIEADVSESLNSVFNEFNENTFLKIELNIDNLLSNIDFDRKAENYLIDNYHYPDDDVYDKDDNYYSNGTYHDTIDAIFER